MEANDFIIGGIASMGATIFTNPIEVIKTRIQLQGEMLKKGTYVEPYKGIVNAFITVAKNDGFLALQKGIAPALYFQFILNAIRLGTYTTAYRHNLVQRADGQISFFRGLFWGATGGIIGSLISSPFFLVKTQLQSQAVKKIAVGYQHKHKGMINAIVEIYKANGFGGLWRGAQSTIPRAALGSGAQLATFGKCKNFLQEHGIQHPTLNSFASGLIAGSVMSLAITPPDLISTRLYNQGVDEKGRGIYYKGVFDCLRKILKTEGFFGLYKGFWPNYLRIAPHSTLVLLFFDELMLIQRKYFD